MSGAFIVIAVFAAIEVALVYVIPMLAIAFVFNESPAWNVFEWEPAGRAVLLFAAFIFAPAIGISSRYLVSTFMSDR